MITGQQVVDEARTWLGTPYTHQGRLKSVGVDCIGLIIGVAHNLGLSEYDIYSYARIPDGTMMLQLMQENMTQISNSEVLLGDIGLFSFIKHPQHVAIFSDLGMIHSFSSTGKCVEHRFAAPWDKRLISVFRLKGII